MQLRMKRRFKFDMYFYFSVILLQLSMLSYTATITGDSPGKIMTEGTFIHTDREIYIAGDILFFKLYVLDKTLNLTGKSKIAYLSLRNVSKQSVVNFQVNLINGTAFGSIYLPDTLSTGYYQLLSFTNWMRNDDVNSISSRELFIANRFDSDLKVLGSNLTSPKNEMDSTQMTIAGIKKVNMVHDTLINIFTDKKKYKSREKVSLTLKWNESKIPKFVNVSVSVYEKSPQLLNPNNTTGHFINNVADTLKAKINSNASKTPFRNFADQNGCNYLPEVNGRILQGKVLENANNHGVKDAIVFLSVCDTLANLKYSYTDSSGLFRFLLNDGYSKNEINVKVKSEKQTNNVHVVFDNPYLVQKDFSPVLLENDSKIQDFIIKSQNILKINKAYQSTIVPSSFEKVSSFGKHTTFPKVYEKATQVVKPSDFEFLPDFLNISQELLHSINIKKKNGIYSCNFMDYALNTRFTGSPTIFLNGILIDDINQLLSFNSDKLARIECINAARIFGDLSFDGIMAVFTKKIQQPDFPIMNNYIVPPVNNVSFSTFPNHDLSDLKGKKTPDFLQLLYWNPSVQFSDTVPKQLEFITSDNSGSFIVNVQGFSSNGEIISETKEIIVESYPK